LGVRFVRYCHQASFAVNAPSLARDLLALPLIPAGRK
jgi:hypothetical protein